MNDALQDAITEIEAPPEEVSPLEQATTEVDKRMGGKGVRKLAQYDPNALKLNLSDYFKDDPTNDQRFIRDTRGKPWSIKDTPAWGVGQGVIKGATGLGQALFAGPDKPALPKPKHGGLWDNIRYYAGYFGPTHVAASGIETLAEIGSGLYMLSTGAVEGIGEGILKGMGKIGADRIPGWENVDTETFDSIIDWTQNKLVPYEKKRALASTMAILMSDDVDAINVILDEINEHKLRESGDIDAALESRGRTYFGMRGSDKEYTESDIANALVQLRDQYEAIKMTPEDWEAANAFWEGLTGHYASPEAFGKKMREDPAEPLVDILDIWFGGKALAKGKKPPTVPDVPTRTGATPTPTFDGGFEDVAGIGRDIQRRPIELPPTEERMPFTPGTEQQAESFQQNIGEYDIRTDPTGDRGRYQPEFAPQVAGGVQEPTRANLNRELQSAWQRVGHAILTEDARQHLISRGDTDIETIVGALEETAEDLGRPIDAHEVDEILTVHENSRSVFQRYEADEITGDEFESSFQEYNDLIDRLRGDTELPARQQGIGTLDENRRIDANFFDELPDESTARAAAAPERFNQNVEFLARQDPSQIDFTELSHDDFEALMAIAERDENDALLSAMLPEAERRLAQEHRNTERINAGTRDNRQGQIFDPTTERRISPRFGDEFLRVALNNTDEQIEQAFQFTRQQMERELELREMESRPDVLTGDTQRSASGFDTTQGAAAARRGTQAENDFDSVETYPTPDSIVEAMDGIYTELDSLTPAQLEQKKALERQLSQAQEALRRRIPGRGVRLNMGIDPTQLGEAARGLWENIRSGVQRIASRPERLEFPDPRKMSQRELQRNRAEQRLIDSINSGESDSTPMVSGGVDSDDVRAAAQDDVSRLQDYAENRDLAEDISASAVDIIRDLPGTLFRAGEGMGSGLVTGESAKDILGSVLGTFGASLSKSLGKAFRGKRLYNRQAAMGDTTANALRDIYKSVGIEASDKQIAEHIKNLESLIGENRQATIVTDILAEVKDQTLQRATYPEVKNLLNTKLREGQRPTELGKSAVDIQDTISHIDTLLEVLRESQAGDFTRTGQQDPPSKKIRQLLDNFEMDRTKFTEEIDRANLAELMTLDNFTSQEFMRQILNVEMDRDARRLFDNYFPVLFRQIRRGETPQMPTEMTPTITREAFRNFVRYLEDDSEVANIMQWDKDYVRLHDLVNLWRGIYDRFFRQVSESTAFDHPDIINLLDVIQSDVKKWAGDKRMGNESIKKWVKGLETRQEKISQAFRKSVVESFDNMQPNQFFDTFTQMDTNTLEAVFDMISERSDTKPRIPLRGSPTPVSRYTNKEIQAFLRGKGKGVKGRGQSRTWSPTERLELLRTVLVDQLLERTYARRQTRPTADNPTQAKDAQQIYIHTLQELLDDIDLRNGQSSGRGELIFGAEVWQNLREMRPSKALFQWLSTAKNKGRGGVIKRAFGGLLVEMLPYLRSTEHGKEFYRDVIDTPDANVKWSSLLDVIFSGMSVEFVTKGAPGAKATGSAASRSQNRQTPLFTPPSPEYFVQ